MPTSYDALLVVSFGGPDGPDDVMPFLENVTRGRNIPGERLLEVAEHYHHFGGASPINAQNRALIHAILTELNQHGPQMPVYWGNRNWHPLLSDTMRQMAADGVSRAAALVTSAFGSYSGCRQYREDIERARAEVGEAAPVVDKLRTFFNHPGFIEPMIDRTRDALAEVPESHRAATHVVFTAHSVPVSMAETSPLEQQLREAVRLVAEGISVENVHIAYQSRSGPPQQPWLEPDVCQVLRELAGTGHVEDVVVVPIGFLSDHMEVQYDLDVEARHVADELGLKLHRASTVGTHPRFVRMIRELIVERTTDGAQRAALGTLGPSPDACPPDCCRPPERAR